MSESDSTSSNGSDGSDGSSIPSSSHSTPHPRKVLAQIYRQKHDKKTYETWGGEQDVGIFVCARFDKELVKRHVHSNCGDILKKNIEFWNIQDFPLLDLTITPKGHYSPMTIGNYLTLPSSSSTIEQPLALRECWHNVTNLLKKFMDEKKIYMFHPRSGVKMVSTRHFAFPDRYKPSLWLDITDIRHTLPDFNLDFFTSNPSFKEPIRYLDKSEFENPNLYEVRIEYVPNPVKRSMTIGTGVKSLVEAGEPPFKRRKHEDGQKAGKSRRRLKRSFKRKTIKRINKRNKRKTIKLRFKKR